MCSVLPPCVWPREWSAQRPAGLALNWCCQYLPLGVFFFCLVRDSGQRLATADLSSFFFFLLGLLAGRSCCLLPLVYQRKECTNFGQPSSPPSPPPKTEACKTKHKESMTIISVM